MPAGQFMCDMLLAAAALQCLQTEEKYVEVGGAKTLPCVVCDDSCSGTRFVISIILSCACRNLTCGDGVLRYGFYGDMLQFFVSFCSRVLGFLLTRWTPAGCYTCALAPDALHRAIVCGIMMVRFLECFCFVFILQPASGAVKSVCMFFTPCRRVLMYAEEPFLMVSILPLGCWEAGNDYAAHLREKYVYDVC